MATLFCKWPEADQAKALAYNAECTAQNPDVGATWANVRQDRNNNWTVPLLGPPWSFDGVTPFPEPASCLVLRVDAVVVEAPEWPVPSEDA
jgi:hypothetical protein